MSIFRGLNKFFSIQRKFIPFQNINHFYRFCSTRPNLELSDPAVLKYLEYLKTEYWDLKTKSNNDRLTQTKLQLLFPVVKVLEERSCIVDNINNLEELNENDSKDKDLLELMKEERETYNSILKDLDSKLLDALFEDSIKYSVSDTIVEVSSGVGGQEAMLFAREMLDMYIGYCQYKNWECSISQIDKSDIGGVRKGCLSVSGAGSFERLQVEAGVHRVQRVPATERGGRLHTSTISVAVLLQPTEIEVNIPDRHLRIETKRATGAGGQHVNTTDSAVRVVYLPTGLSVECQTGRDQHQNKKTALAKLRALLFQQQSEKQEMEERACRKSQVGLGLRNEKIRTYNFNQDRVTDHRIVGSTGTVHDLQNLMQGGAGLDELITRLLKFTRSQNVLQHIETFREAEKTKRASK